MVKIELSISQNNRYAISIESGITKRLGKIINKNYPDASRIYVITDKNVELHHRATLLDGMNCLDLAVDLYAIDPGEQSKTVHTVEKIWRYLIDKGCQRRDVIVAFGGGVVTDIVGLAACTFMRGIPYVNVPTSLLGQLDAAIGSKVAVNHECGKNLIGAFYHPDAVYIDPELLRTLSMDEIRNGLSEAIKVAIISSESMVANIENKLSSIHNGNFLSLERIIANSIKAKIDFIKPDLFENELKRALNFGHTFGHALETIASYKGIRHGEAVAIGMATALRMSNGKGFCSKEISKRLIKLIFDSGLPIFPNEGTPSDIWKALSIIQKVRNGYFHEVLPTGVGTYTFYDEITEEDIYRYMYTGQDLEKK